jgi:hypothetical protein
MTVFDMTVTERLLVWQLLNGCCELQTALKLAVGLFRGVLHEFVLMGAAHCAYLV